MNRRTWRIALWILAGLLTLLALGLLLSRLILFPQGRYNRPTQELSLLTQDDVQLFARLLPHDGATSGPEATGQTALVIVAHGFSANGRTPEIIALAEDLAVEFDVLVLDLRGHGASEGAYPLDFESTALDLQAAVEWGRSQGYRRIGAAGFSLGAAAAILEQARSHNLDSLAAVACPAALSPELALGHWVRSPLGRLFFRLMGTRLAPPAGTAVWPVDVAGRVAPTPLLVVHDGDDSLVPEPMSLDLHGAARQPKELLLLPGQPHATLGEEGRTALQQWFHQTLQRAEAGPPPWAHVLTGLLTQETPAPPPVERGRLSGTVYSTAGDPLSGAVVLVATLSGHTFVAYTDGSGTFDLEAPPGRYIVIASAAGYHADVYRRGTDARTPIDLPTDAEISEIQFTLRPDLPQRLDPAAISLTLSPAQEVSAAHPRPVTVRRTEVTYEYDGRQVDTCALYEPLTATGRLPVILAVYPSEPARWEGVSIPMAAEGYVVLAYGPLYEEKVEEMNLPAYGRDLVAAWALLEGGRLTSRADPDRYGILTGSIASFILELARPELPPPRLINGVGGGYDLFLVLRDLYENPDYVLEETFVLALAALGRPDLYPDTFLQLSMRYRASDLPPMGLFHSTADEILLIDQAEEMAATLEALGRPAELHLYSGLEHYPGVQDPPPETLRMYGEIMGLFERYLADH